MNIDKFGQQIYTEEDLCRILLQNPNIILRNVLTTEKISLPDELELGENIKLIEYQLQNCTVKEFDCTLQNNWFMPDEYKNLNIAEYVLSLCKSDAELQRAGEELILYQKNDMFDLLRYLKYLVDVMRQKNVVWGVGRGSSVSSFILFLIGVHKINSLYYDLSIDEFIK